MNTISDLVESTNWKAQLHGIHCEIVRWPNPARKRYHDELEWNWNYYCLLLERETKPELWPAVWLEDKMVDWGITHDYYAAPFSAEIDWHGGVTFYQKYPNIEGRRMVKIGCDYAHLCDYERGYDYTLEEVFADCLNTAKQLSEIFLLENKPQ